jgi:N,N'-diacetyllegionaminate synthase
MESISDKYNTNRHVTIIAEAGVNHNGNLELARKMVYAAKEAGADYVKFQTAVPELVISDIAPKAEYQKETTGTEQSQLEMCRAIHLPLSDYSGLKALCDEVGIGFMSTPFDLVSIDCLNELNMDYWKIPSGEITNLPYLRKIARLGGRVILSSGMSTLDEVKTAVKILQDNGLRHEDIYLLHCTTQYPTPFNAVNLKAMQSLKDAIKCGGVGYSDHTVGIEVPVAAVGMGACIIEKHFTLDKNMPGPDHRASLEPQELKAMVDAIRNIEQAIGDGDKVVTDTERPNIVVARKSIVAARDIKAGEILTEENITVKRPGNGISPMLWDSVIGTAAIHDFERDHLIEIK